MNDKDVQNLHILRIACLDAAMATTAYDPTCYIPGTLVGHCGVVAQIVQDHYGGHLMTGRAAGAQHLWNKLPDGTEVDLTSDQFGGDGLHPVVCGRMVPPRRTRSPRAVAFAQHVLRRHSNDA